ncbi:MAG: hypothetical protein JXB29_09415 [Sedimentisphaerales bacterium]|nr:hypothetical protein [Sedimentisphaerales bacterium]
MNIIKAIADKNLFRPFLEDGKGNLSSWFNWGIALRCLYGLRMDEKHSELIQICTGRDINSFTNDGFETALFLTGRRSGKSRIAAIVGAYEACLSGREKKLSKGETGMVAVIAPTTKQARVVKNYLRGIFETPLLQNEIVRETQEGFLLSNNVLIEILTGDWRSIRGYTLIACVVDEVCFFGLDAESKVRSDTELIRAVKPSLATTNGRLICISSPYAKKGWAFNQYKRNFGNDNGKILVWNCPSRIMNPTLPQSVVDEAMAEDLQAAKSEYLGEFRDDIIIWLPREAIELAVKKGRRELLPRTGIWYQAFVDVSGGRNDSSAIAIGHKEGTTVTIDYVKEYKAPHDPYQIIGSMAVTLRKFNVRRVIGDNYSAEFVAQAFYSQGIGYEKSKLPKSQLYLELLPMICSGSIELLDNETLVNQLSSLERRTRSGGKDTVDHPQGGHDDLANATAGVCFLAGKRRRRVGGLFPKETNTNIFRKRRVLQAMAKSQAQKQKIFTG